MVLLTLVRRIVAVLSTKSPQGSLWIVEPWGGARARRKATEGR